MQFKVANGPITMDCRGLLLVLTRKQADRRRHAVKLVMPDGSRVAVTPALMRPAPELPELGTYAIGSAFEFKGGEVIGFPSGSDVVSALGKERMSKLEAIDDEAKGATGETKPKAEKKPRPAHGGPAHFRPADSLKSQSASAAAPAPVASVGLAPAASPGAGAATSPHSISGQPGKRK